MAAAWLPPPRNMAALPNLAIGALHLTGAADLAQAIRRLSRDATGSPSSVHNKCSRNPRKQRE